METQLSRKPYPTDVTDDEWACVAPYLTLMRPDAPQRRYAPREVFNAVRRIVRAGSPWRSLPHDFPAWELVSQQTRRWLAAGCFDSMVHDPRALPRWSAHRADDPTAASLASRTRQSTPESGARAGYDGHERRKGSRVHPAVDTLGHLLAPRVGPADEQDRARADELAEAVPDATGHNVEVAFVDQESTGEDTAGAAAPGSRLVVIRLPRRWVVERSFAWTARFRRLARDYDRLPATVAGLHFVAFACLMPHRLLTPAAQSP